MSDYDDSPLSAEEVEFLDRHSGTRRMPAAEVLQIVQAGRAAVAAAEFPDVPHVAEVVAAFPAGSRDEFSVAQFVENARLDYLGGEVGVREYLEAGHDPAPVIALAQQAHQFGV